MIEKIYKDFKQNMFAIHQLTERDKKHENAQTFLGELWEILNPLIMTVVMVLVFSTMFEMDSIENYPLFVLCGNTLFNFFSQGTSSCLGALVGNKNLLIRSRLNRRIYVVQKVVLAFRNLVFSLFILAIVIALYQIQPSLIWLLLIVDIYLLILIILGIGKILSIANVFFGDMTYFYRIIIVFLFYCSALFYDASRLPILMQKIMMLNPMYDAVYIFRSIITSSKIVEPQYWIFLVIYALAFYAFGSVIYNRYSDNVIANI